MCDGREPPLRGGNHNARRPGGADGHLVRYVVVLLCTCAMMDMYIISCIAFIEIAPRRGAISILHFHVHDVHDQAFCLAFSHLDYEDYV